MSQKPSDQVPADAEIIQRRMDDAVRRALNTPPLRREEEEGV
jgi:hypothetical protein